MSPCVSVSLRGMHAAATYHVALEIIPLDDKRYRFTNNTWTAVGSTDEAGGLKVGGTSLWYYKLHRRLCPIQSDINITSVPNSVVRVCTKKIYTKLLNVKLKLSPSRSGGFKAIDVQCGQSEIMLLWSIVVECYVRKRSKKLKQPCLCNYKL